MNSIHIRITATLLGLLLTPFSGFAQELFTEAALLEAVRQSHPEAKRIRLTGQRAEAEMRLAKSVFDPKLAADWGQKEFGGKTYYSLGESTLSIPTWLGIDVKMGYTQNYGYYLNPENNVPEQGLWMAGVSVPLLQGLFVNENRIRRKQGLAGIRQASAQQQLQLNDFFYEVGYAYWSWAEAWYAMSIQAEALRLAQQRLQATQIGLKNGDKAAIDTLEAYLQVQTRRLSLQEAQLEYQQNTQKLANYQWGDSSIQQNTVVPPPIERLKEVYDWLAQQQTWNDSLLNNHPSLLALQVKQEQLELDLKWKREKFKPKAKAYYYGLQAFSNKEEYQNTPAYKAGISLEVPIGWREASAGVQLGELKLQDLFLKREFTRRKLQTKAQAYLQKMQQLASQVRTYEDVVQQYTLLVNAEREKLRVGESSLFLVNSRELKLITAQRKQLSLRIKLRKAYLGWRWVLGTLPNS